MVIQQAQPPQPLSAQVNVAPPNISLQQIRPQQQQFRPPFIQTPSQLRPAPPLQPAKPPEMIASGPPKLPPVPMEQAQAPVPPQPQIPEVVPKIESGEEEAIPSSDVAPSVPAVMTAEVGEIKPEVSVPLESQQQVVAPQPMEQVEEDASGQVHGGIDEAKTPMDVTNVGEVGVDPEGDEEEEEEEEEEDDEEEGLDDGDEA